jgi:multicomponent Na+:H+ antiporter subunit A
VPILLLVLGGAFTKSAQFPFHFWLPNAMEAPTPVSAYLHSATMVKAGVYLLMRLNPTLGDTVLWSTILPIFGCVTLLVGAILALRQTDLKLMLAYTTVASLGLLVALTGTSDEAIIKGAALYLVAHALFKAALFMVAGTIDHEAGTRDLTKLGGLRSAMPITAAAALLAALSMGGLPPFIGFLAKEYMYKGAAYPDLQSILLTTSLVLGNAMMFAAGFAVALRPFYGQKKETPKHAHEGPLMLWAGPVTLASLSVIGGVLAATTGDIVIQPLLSAILGQKMSRSAFTFGKASTLQSFCRWSPSPSAPRSTSSWIRCAARLRAPSISSDGARTKASIRRSQAGIDLLCASPAHPVWPHGRLYDDHLRAWSRWL